MGQADDKETAKLLATLQLHDLFRFIPQTQDASKLRQSVLVKKLSAKEPLFSNINQLAEFLDDRAYDHSNAALNIIFSYTGKDLQKILEDDKKLRIEVGNYQKFIPKQEVEEKSGKRYIPAHYESTPVYDHPHVRSLLKGKNRSNLTLLLFKLFFTDYPSAPQLDDFKLVCESLRPKLRTIDYGILLNHAAQPCQTPQLPERYYNYIQRLKISTALLHYILENQATNSARKLHQAFFQHFIETIRDDAALRPDEKMTLLQMCKLCFEYTLLSDKDLVKNGSGLFAAATEAIKHRYHELNQIVGKEFLFAAPDPLNDQYLDKEMKQALSAPQTITIQAEKLPGQFNRKINLFEKIYDTAIAEVQPSIRPDGN